MVRAGVILGLLLIALPAAAAPKAKPPLPWPTGIYSSVYMSKYTGDLGGMEIRFYEEAGKHMAEFVMCEGWCNTAYKVPLTRGDNGFIFTTAEELTTYDGTRPVSTEIQEIHFVAWPEGKNLRIQGWFGRQEFESKPEKLRPASKIYGIGVARNEMQARANEQDEKK